MNRKKLKILLSLFAFNSIYLYFFSSSDHHLFIHHKLLPGNHKAPGEPQNSAGKTPSFPYHPPRKAMANSPVLPSVVAEPHRGSSFLRGLLRERLHAPNRPSTFFGGKGIGDLRRGRVVQVLA
ncbi:hypothetical protein CK203_011837 [Vitis vinifera]|uniref:Uncharacterized protein n=1 Tax=Vitis vinifera TaxID=29760 RepID=A0A438K0D0_VITVI|nr:hypothetical protein CK203_011837 [Vitis vinifera]